MTVEIACKEAVFHFNKKHLEDPTIPMWTVKTGGNSYYVNHVTAELPWTTKETPDNQATKGSIKFHKALLTIDDENCATFTTLTASDLSRLKAIKRNYARIIITSRIDEIIQWLKDNVIKHSPIKTVSGSCGSKFHLCDIKKQGDLVLMALIFTNCYRVLLPNEVYFRAYEDPELLAKLDADDYYDGDETNDDDE